MCFGIGIANGQTSKAPIPEVLNDIRYHQATDNSLKPLEKTTARYVTKSKALGYGGIIISFVLDSDKSPIRFVSAERMRFVVAMADGTGDPTGWFTLYKATVKKGKRSGNFGDYKVFGKSSGNKEVVSYSVKSLGKQVYEIIPDTKLDKGEYFFANKGSLSKYGNTAVDVFAFGID
ncbi:hypothetical protein FAM09_07185 [Niastella caeni]|uniref:Uncharacterized protein n=1 Tax=Niastella caeni TaxID=2569763 RepID=A0A4V4H1V0_9BACT|nr:hypothetical protein [Niastella caeni]THU41876.1 hypothetical protein FAM09_07185 [Niastella caeni]